ncbi:MAG: hypothetical protein GY805_13695 [Chloroflexi bacterium]|nr:hypothetical protein [Chloroflexota bacterium]
MFTRRLISRMTQLFILFALLFMLVTAVLTAGQPVHRAFAADPTPTPIPTEAPDGWSDPVGG